LSDPRLNPEFSRRLRQLIERVERASGWLILTDGFRTPKQQVDVRAAKPALAARPGSSLHEQGRAADLEGSVDLAQVYAGSFGLRYGVDGKDEPYHFWLP